MGFPRIELKGSSRRVGTAPNEQSLSGCLATLRQAPNEFALEMRVAAAVKWHELGRASQGRAAEIAGLTRAGFIDALSRYQVSPFQYTAEELAEERSDAD